MDLGLLNPSLSIPFLAFSSQFLHFSICQLSSFTVCSLFSWFPKWMLPNIFPAIAFLEILSDSILCTWPTHRYLLSFTIVDSSIDFASLICYQNICLHVAIIQKKQVLQYQWEMHSLWSFRLCQVQCATRGPRCIFTMQTWPF